MTATIKNEPVEEKKPRVKRPKPCPICCFDVPGLSRSPNCCRNPDTGEAILHGDNEKCCDECWDAYISYSIETKPATEIVCIFCPSLLSEEEIARLSRKATMQRYQAKLEDAKGNRCPFRCQGSGTPAQPHFGRIFTCKCCSAETCTACTHPHDPSSTCSDFAYSIYPHHNPAEAAMQKAGYIHCPSCHSWGELSDSPLERCEAMTCSACYYRWCGGCGVAWVGEKSYATMGMKAHKEGCKYHRLLPSVYGRKRLYEAEKGAWDEAQRAKRQRKVVRDGKRAEREGKQRNGEGKKGMEEVKVKEEVKSEAEPPSSMVAEPEVKKEPEVQVKVEYEAN